RKVVERGRPADATVRHADRVDPGAARVHRERVHPHERLRGVDADGELRGGVGQRVLRVGAGERGEEEQRSDEDPWGCSHAREATAGETPRAYGFLLSPDPVPPYRPGMSATVRFEGDLVILGETRVPAHEPEFRREAVADVWPNVAFPRA